MDFPLPVNKDFSDEQVGLTSQDDTVRLIQEQFGHFATVSVRFDIQFQGSADIERKTGIFYWNCVKGKTNVTNTGIVKY